MANITETDTANLADIRREYTRDGLKDDVMPSDPLALFAQWLSQARDANLSDPTAMVVATVDGSGQPYMRTVLMKHFDHRGFVFYTNLGSRKAQHIEGNARVCLHFPWHMLDRQVHIIGQAEQLSTAEVLRYFVTRPRESQLSAWASKQSSRIGTRQLLEAKFFELKNRFSQGEIPVPTFWGGYRVSITSMEFWQGGEHRLHDRFLYEHDGEVWCHHRLAP